MPAGDDHQTGILNFKQENIKVNYVHCKQKIREFLSWNLEVKELKMVEC